MRTTGIFSGPVAEERREACPQYELAHLRRRLDFAIPDMRIAVE